MNNDNPKPDDTAGLAAPVSLNTATLGIPDPTVKVVKALFDVGEIVQLKSGSVAMTLALNIGDGRCECCYFDYAKQTFSAAMLFQDMIEKTTKPSAS